MSAALTRFHFFQTGNAHSPPWQTFLPAVRSFGHFALFLFSDRSNHFTYRQLTRSSLRCPVLDARASRSRKKQSTFVNCFSLKTGNDLFSQAVSRQVSSALKSLTAVFGMGTGGSSSPLSPDFILSFLSTQTMKNLSSPTSLRLSPSLG